MMLRVLSPLHIGNGNQLTPVDIYPEQDRVYVLDIDKLIDDLQNLGISLEEILHLLKNPPGDRYVWKGYIDELNLNPKDYARYTLRTHGTPGKESMQIREFIKLNERPYVPGSSVKGALRTAVLYKVLKECGDSATAMNLVSRFDRKLAEKIGWSNHVVEFYVEYLLNELQKEEAAKQRGKRYNFDRKRADDLLEAIVFGMEPDRRSGVRYEPKRDPLRALIVRDSQPVGRRHLAVYRVDVIGNPQPIPIWVEALEPGTATEIEMKIEAKVLRLNSGHFNGLLWECLENYGKPWEVFEDFLWKAVNEFYDEVIKTELTELSRFGKYETNVKSFYSSLKSHDGHLLRLGWGSGWLATTVGILLRKEGKWEGVRRKLGLGRNPQSGKLSSYFPKTRRLADGLPMGWVVLQ
ncbi:type III-A CRISPR-associated RAMP protein Csm5 [Pyrococcus yayanosii]|uniref:CRISPR system Cms protein Csm5 n=1 Tax=Pyrococcus yayanosii (strain CH1 / JCM 16557) TaxID=529709 RepID=F8AGC2_PYRYC|nr:type III-A CRISPR-associated RAMP protein Csm5 [Pyrococcus yayanosii]AEH25118.1 CRISPR-associated RAMP protein, Csm5 family [Pyrococcus yayanosii CH1]